MSQASCIKSMEEFISIQRVNGLIQPALFLALMFTSHLLLLCIDSYFHESRPRGYKTFIMLNSNEHEIQLLIKAKIPTNEEVSCFKSLRSSDIVFIMLINIKMPTIVGILTFMSRINFMLSSVEYEKHFIASGPSLYYFCKYCLIKIHPDSDSAIVNYPSLSVSMDNYASIH